MVDIAYIALGSNVGDRRSFLAFARNRMRELPGSRIIAESAVEETDAITLEGDTQDAFLNQIVALETSLAPGELLAALHAIENEAGRVRTHRWEPRTLDLDIVLFENTSVRESGLVVPHPELPHREFWQRELDQVRPTR